MNEHTDVVVVGGGAAGLAAALQLVRSRRSVVVVDAGEPRNAAAAHMHGYLGHEGLPPGEFLALGQEEVRRYGGRIVDGVVAGVTPLEGGRFWVTLADGTGHSARRVLLATGLVDQLPEIAGVAEQWGRGVIHCPYCHGWEVRDRSIAVIATGPLATHQALLFRQLSDRVTVVIHEGNGPEGEDRRRLAARQVAIVDGPVRGVEVDGDEVRGVRLASGKMVDADVVVVAPRFVARAGLLADLGVLAVPAPMGMGEAMVTNPAGETTVPGLYAAGNVHDVSQQVLQAAAEGSRVAAAINADLALEDADRALQRHVGDSAEDWDRRYTDSGHKLWSGEPNSALVAETVHLEPGTALDLGCGEGADAIWLAGRGWEVTAVDISAVAIDRGREAATTAGIAIDWVRADVPSERFPTGSFDLVTVMYPAFRHTPDDGAMRAILDAVAPGGTLLVVHHLFDGHDGHRPNGFDPADYVQPPDIAKHLHDGWAIEIHDERARVRPAGSPGPDVPDLVLRARRAG
jgi:thioredoxin reductase/SAM-dependent methyltransferase